MIFNDAKVFCKEMEINIETKRNIGEKRLPIMRLEAVTSHVCYIVTTELYRL